MPVNQKRNEKIEVVRYQDAPWAPKLAGETFGWAIRVTSSTGNQIVTVHNGIKWDAMKKGKHYLKKLRKQFAGEITHKTRAMTLNEQSRDRYLAKQRAGMQ